VIEAAKAFHALIEHVFAGVPEGRMAKIVGKPQGFSQVVIEAKASGDGPGDLGHLERMGKASAVMIPLVRDEDLGLALEASEGARMHNAVAVAFEWGSMGAFGLLVEASARA
jgi:hypothetical protein